jgi:Secretion system C-terminal sorting domain
MDKWKTNMPLTLLNFSGSSKENNTHLNWQTTNEKDANRFEIERSLDGVSFTKIGQTKCVGGATKVNKYTFTDYNIVGNDNHYYRLKQIDTDGKFNYSTIIVMEPNGNSKSILIYPNPANIDIMVDCKKGFQIFNSTGQMVRENKQATTRIDISDLPNGVYILKTDKQVGQFIKAK